MDILNKELKETYSNINKDIKIFKIIIKSNLSLDISILNQMEDIIISP